MKRLLVLLGLLWACVAWAAREDVFTDPTAGANGTGYADSLRVTYRGQGIDSTVIKVSLDFSARKFVRLSNLTIEGSVTLDSLCANVVFDSVKILGSFEMIGADSCKIANSTIIGAGLAIRTTANMIVPADTVRYPDMFADYDTIQNVRAILTPGYEGLGFHARGMRSAFISALNCSIYCGPGKRAGGAKFFMSSKNTIQNSRWRIHNMDDVLNQESGYWAMRDLSSWNTFTTDTVWTTGVQTNINFNHAGDQGSDYINRQTDNTFNSCVFVNLSNAQSVGNQIYYQSKFSGDRFTNCVFVANEEAFSARASGTLDAPGGSGRQPWIRHCTFYSVRGIPFSLPEKASDGGSGLVVTDNVFYSARTDPAPVDSTHRDWYARNVGTMRYWHDAAADVDTVDHNLHFWFQPDPSFPRPITIASSDGPSRSYPGPGDVFYTSRGKERQGRFGSPYFRDSTAGYTLDLTPDTLGYAVRGGWRNGYVGAISPPAPPDSVPETVGTPSCYANFRNLFIVWSSPRDDKGVRGWRIWRSSTQLTDETQGDLVASYDVPAGSPSIAQGTAITTAVGIIPAGATRYYYITTYDTKGQKSAKVEYAVTAPANPSRAWACP